MICKIVGVAVVLMSVVGQVEGAITQIGLNDFVDPRVLDFESTPTGNIGGTNSLFTDFGISSVEYTGYRMADYFDHYSNVSQALWVNAGGLVVARPGMSGFADSNLSYTLNLADLHQRIGIGVNDHNGRVNFDFFNSGNAVGSFVIDPTGTSGLAMSYLENTESFDSVTITASMNGGDPAGFAIDNITLDETIQSRTHVLSVGVNWGEMYGLDLRRSATAFHNAIGSALNIDADDNTLLCYDASESIGDKISFFDSLRATISQVGPNDTFILYIATHGATLSDPPFDDESDETSISPADEVLYLPGTANSELDAAGVEYGYTMVQDDELYSYIANNAPDGWESANKLIVLEACHSGGFWDGGDTGDLDRLMGNTALLAAAHEDTTAYASRGMGFMTSAIVESLTTGLDEANGDDDVLTIQELLDTVTKPNRFADLEGQDFTIIGNDPVLGTVVPFHYTSTYSLSDEWQDVALVVPEASTLVLLLMGAATIFLRGGRQRN